ncbi:MAG: GerMN domain-containing protein [Cyanobacteria bacterium REEB67]|nr:GerMN domain-containing protein [Cyanobacteria bacterium REEB67]
MFRPKNSSPVVALLLLVVPFALASCKGRAVLDGKGDKKQVAGQVLTPETATTTASATSSDSTTGGVPGGAAISGVNAATIWFTKPDGDKLAFVSETREHKAPFTTPEEALSFALNELLGGPKGALASEGASSEIPPGTVLIGVAKDKNTGAIIVDLSRRFAQGSGPDSFDARLEQLKRTAEAVVPGKSVFLNVEGKRLEETGDGLEIKQPISGPGSSVAGATADTPSVTAPPPFTGAPAVAPGTTAPAPSAIPVTQGKSAASGAVRSH